MVTFLPLMVQSAVPGGLGRLLLSCGGCFCCWAEAASIGCAKAKAASIKMVIAIAEKCLPVMMNVLSLKGFHYRAAGPPTASSRGRACVEQKSRAARGCPLITSGSTSGRTSNARAHPGGCPACRDKRQRGRGSGRDIRGAARHAHAQRRGNCRNTDRGAAPSGHARSWLRRGECRVDRRAGPHSRGANRDHDGSNRPAPSCCPRPQKPKTSSLLKPVLVLVSCARVLPGACNYCLRVLTRSDAGKFRKEGLNLGLPPSHNLRTPGKLA